MLLVDDHHLGILTKIDCRLKLFSLLISIIAINLFSLPKAILLCAMAIAISLLSASSLRRLFVKSVFIFLFVLLIAVMRMISLSMQGGSENISSLIVSQFSQSVRIVGSFFLLVGMMQSTSFLEIIHALNFFHFPEKLVALFYLQFAFSSVLLNEINKKRIALKLRVNQQRLELREVAHLFALLLAGLNFRSRKIYWGMISRNYQLSLQTVFRKKLSRADFYYSFFYVIFIISLWVA